MSKDGAGALGCKADADCPYGGKDKEEVKCDLEAPSWGGQKAKVKGCL
jgi:hypothetical protein